MAYTSYTIWEVRTTGSDTNGGAFVNGGSGSDYSQQNSPQYSGTDLEINSSNNLQVKSTTAGSPIAADVGNMIMISNGLSWTLGWYQIVSQDGTWWTLDRTPGAAGLTGAHFAVGGALASPGVAWAVARNNYTGSHYRGEVWIQDGTYGITNSTISGPVPSSGCYLRYANCVARGYNASLGRGVIPTTRPILQLQSSFGGPIAYISFSSNATYTTGTVWDLELDMNSQGTTYAIYSPAEA